MRVYVIEQWKNWDDYPDWGLADYDANDLNIYLTREAAQERVDRDSVPSLQGWVNTQVWNSKRKHDTWAESKALFDAGLRNYNPGAEPELLTEEKARQQALGNDEAVGYRVAEVEVLT